MRQTAHQVKDAAIYQLVRAALALASRRSLDEALGAADRLGDLAFVTLRKTRRLALEHLEFVFGDELSPADRREIARLSLRSFARSICEMAKLDEIRPMLDSYIALTGWENVQNSIDRGAIICSGHLGNWELGAAYFVKVKQLQVAAVARRLDEPRLNQLLIDLRSSNGVDTILREDPSAGRQLLQAIKGHRLLAMLIDQDTRVPSITVPFLGHAARTPVAPATLAIRRNLPIIVTYSRRRSAGGLEVVVKGPLLPNPSIDRETGIRELTADVNRLLSDAIRDNPTQWPWWHRRWRRPPQPRLDPDALI